MRNTKLLYCPYWEEGVLSVLFGRLAEHLKSDMTTGRKKREEEYRSIANDLYCQAGPERIYQALLSVRNEVLEDAAKYLETKENHYITWKGLIKGVRSLKGPEERR